MGAPDLAAEYYSERNDLDHDLSYINLDRKPEDSPVHTKHSLCDENNFALSVRAQILDCADCRLCRLQIVSS